MFPIHTHLKMLNDRHRMQAYKESIFQNVHPGDIVADIGTGTGILAFLALQAGADRIYALESGDIIERARKLAAHNDVLDKIVFINADSREAQLPEKVDVIITETFGGLGIDEGVLDILADARERFLKPDGCVLPETLFLRALPVRFNRRHPYNSIAAVFNGMNTSGLEDLAVNMFYGLREADLGNCQPVAKPGHLYVADLMNYRPLDFPLKMVSKQMRLTEDACDGIVVYPEFIFPGNVSLSLFDGRNFTPSHWELFFFPLRDSVRAEFDDGIVFHLTVTERSGLVWQHHVSRGDRREVSSHLSAFGLPALKRLAAD